MINLELLILFLFSFIPPIIYSIWIRNTEKINREKWVPIAICFLWGASIAVIASIILEITFGYIVISIDQGGIYAFLSTVIIAPFAEELTKPLALSLKRVKRELNEFEDGLIYGAVAGLGFSATENLFYGNSFLKEGFLFFLILISIRIIGSSLLHASATAWSGYGYGKKVMKKTSLFSVIPYLLFAIIVHGLYNFLLVFDMIGVGIGLITALILSWFSIHFVRKKIVNVENKYK